MGGCTDCGKKGGCDTRKGEERELLAELLPALFPTRRWGERDDAAAFGSGASENEGRSLSLAAAERLEAPTYFRPGEDGESCDWIYVLCVGRQPGLFELADAAELDVPDGDRIRERYLRVALSTVARVAAVQEVSFELDREGDVYVVSEKPRTGVFDPVLLKRTQKLIALIVEAGFTYLDFGLIDKPPLGFEPGDYAGDYGSEPAIVNYLFYPQPATAVSTRFVPCATAGHAHG